MPEQVPVTDRPPVSVCMATYNGAKHIRQQLASILIQLQPQDEIIISDDSSTDDTLSIIADFKDERIRVFPNNTFRNPIYNFEFALKQAQHEYLFLCDQDDYWYPHKLDTVTKLLSEHLLVVHDCEVVDISGKVLHSSFFDYIHLGQGGFFKNLLKNRYVGCCMAFRRDLLEQSLPFPKSIPMHDWWIGLIAAAKGRVYHCPDKLIRYIRHSETASNTGAKSQRSMQQKVVIRYFLLKNIIIRVLLSR
ncbi:glycosyltransferase family 2 protein [Eisenibacter elegans]|jgi:glycosyltransferase involved in cell wall biosynthesis|uniref:glycosyltransferase family 2 protein n=1 Tax=Eisenibacter elegans TaxID=997 RepID=UPI0003FCF3F5|nr:glycosyltransferase family 2 protein [Eisenibacter elegans]